MKSDDYTDKKYRLFRYNSDVTSFKQPVLRAVLSLLLGVAVLKVWHYTSSTLSIELRGVIGIVGGIAVLTFLYLLIISLCELTEVRDNKAKESGEVPVGAAQKAKNCRLDDVVALIKENDIIEIQILWQGKQIYIGSTACSEPRKKELFNKEYYIGKKTFQSIDDFINEIEMYTFDATITVYMIDGLPCKYTKLGNKKHNIHNQENTNE